VNLNNLKEVINDNNWSNLYSILDNANRIKEILKNTEYENRKK